MSKKSCFITSLICIAIMIIYLVGCASRKQATQAPPMQVQPVTVKPGESVPVSFKRVLIKIPPGKYLGSHHDGLARIPKFQYYWQTSVTIGDTQLSQIACDELKNAGYEVAGEPISVFESGDEWKAKFLLGGTILDASYSTYAPLAGNFSRGTLVIKWELMDKYLKKVVYEKTTSGTASVKGVGIGAAYEAFRDSIRKLLSEEEFSRLLTKSSETTIAKVETPVEPIYIRAISFPLNIKPADLIQKSIQAVVTLRTEGGHGSGFLISEDGYIITNYHAVSGKHIIDVLLSNRITLQAEIVRVNQDLDLALLRLKGSGFTALPLGNSDNIQPGEEVYAIGTPVLVELGQSVSKGIVSGVRRIEGREFIQTDVKVSPGNSGGPIINQKGEVIGIVTWKLVGKASEGLAFSIPANIASKGLNIVIK